MHRAKRIPIRNLHDHLTCVLCKGYLVDATAIIECLHSFCKTCIVRYLETNKYCPICEVQVHKTKPLLNIRPDKTLQDIVYKLVPRLFQNEMRRRRDFYESHPEAKPPNSEQSGGPPYQHLVSPDERIYLTLRYHEGTTQPRYFRCPAAVSVGHIQKLIRAKYDLTDNHRVDILYNQDCLNPSLTLMDIAYIYLWKRKGPMELTYRIYEYIKRLKLDKSGKQEEQVSLEPEQESISVNNNNWKEVQLRISENGEMSITGIQDSILDFVSEDKCNADIITVMDSKNNVQLKRDVPGLKGIGKPAVTSADITISTGVATTASDLLKTYNESMLNITKSVDDSLLAFPKSVDDMMSRCMSNIPGMVSTTCISLSSATTTTVFSTINTSKCSVSASEEKTREPQEKANSQGTLTEPNMTVVTQINNPESKNVPVAETKTSTPSATTEATVVNKVASNADQGDKKLILVLENKLVSSVTTPITTSAIITGAKRKLEAPAHNEQPAKQPKQTILNHSLSLQNLSNNHPLKKHSQMNRDISETQHKSNNQPLDVKKSESNIMPPSHVTVSCGISTSSASISVTSAPSSTFKASSVCEATYSRMNLANKNVTHLNAGRPGTPMTSNVRSPAPKYQPCYMPKTNYNPVINVPKVQSTLNSPPTIRPPYSIASVKSDVRTPTSTSDIKGSSHSKAETQTSPAVTMSQTISINNKLNIKNKPSSPIGYKTLRDPPKSWNSQISKANLSNMTKPVPDPKNADLKNVRPAKFFKMRNNLPRYLGNPASGVKPMYQVHISPEKAPENLPRAEKSEIKKHSIVKIDPKTLKPISEKAPETTSLSNQSDLKINTSSVPIFNPLKLQSSPKSDRRSPKSPHSPKLKSTSPPNKREKLNLNFTPSNPFIPNLTSPTVNPNQFLYPTGPPGFPSYDPRVMAAYHSLFYGQRLPFPAGSLPGLSLDISQRNNFDMAAPSSPKMPNMSRAHSPQSLLPHSTSKASPQSSTTAAKTQAATKSATSSTVTKPQTTAKKSAGEKSLLNAVEKLTQNRAKEIVKNDIVNINNVSDKINSDVTSKSQSEKTENKNNAVPVSKGTEVMKLETSKEKEGIGALSKPTEESEQNNKASKDLRQASDNETAKRDQPDSKTKSSNQCEKINTDKATGDKQSQQDTKDNKNTKENDLDCNKNNSRENEKLVKDNVSDKNNHSKENLDCNIKNAAKASTEKVGDKQCDGKIANTNASTSLVV